MPLMRPNQPQANLNDNPWVILLRNYNQGEYFDQFLALPDDLKQTFTDACQNRFPSGIDDVIHVLSEVQDIHLMQQRAMSNNMYLNPNVIVDSHRIHMDRPDTDIDSWANLEALVNTPEHEERPEIASEPVSPPEFYSTYRGRPIRVSTQNNSDDEQVRQYLNRQRAERREREERRRQERETRQRAEAEEQRRVQHMLEAMVDDSFPKPNFSQWSSSNTLSRIQQDWLRNVQYRINWIFERREREGFNRRNIEYFGLSDMESKLRKQRTGSHALDNETSKFYDWSLGGTDWILRLEYLTLKEHTFLIVRSIHKPSNKEVHYEIRHWNGQKFNFYNNLWTNASVDNNQQNIDDFFNAIRNQLEEYDFEEEDEDEDLMYSHEESEPSDEDEIDDDEPIASLESDWD